MDFYMVYLKKAPPFLNREDGADASRVEARPALSVLKGGGSRQ